MLGITATGPVAGGMFATIQSLAMGAACSATITTVSMSTGLIALAGVAAVAVHSVYLDAQIHGMGPSKPLGNGERFVIVFHNWHHGAQQTSFATKAEASVAFRTGRKLRRMLVMLSEDGAPIVNRWGARIAVERAEARGVSTGFGRRDASAPAETAGATNILSPEALAVGVW